MKAVKWILGVLISIVVVFFIVVYGYFKSTLPDYDGELIVPGITGPVEIIRDSFGMPHIYAENDEDAAFAMGYVMAQDRLFQMDLVRRAVRGELAEILGEGAVGVDKFFRTITAVRSVDDIAGDYPPEVIASMEAYAAGINYYLENHTGPLPLEFTLLGYEPEPWQATDGIAVYYYMAWDLNSSFSTEMLFASIREAVGEELADDLFPSYADGYPTIVPGGISSIDTLKTMLLAREITQTEGGGVSNNWVISGDKSETGMPILANDMHLGHGSPGIWYEAHINTPEMNVSGVVLPGMPFVVVGATDHTAWGFTNTMVDDSDYYIEKLNPENPEQYEFRGRWEDMEVHEEVIRVKDADDVTFSIKLTRHGPIIDEINDVDEPEGYSLSMRWTAPELPLAGVAIYYFNRAKNIDEFEEAIEYFKCPGQNIVYADDQGNIGYWAAMGIPKRVGFSGLLPVPGWDGRHEWQGYVPTGQQPHMRNPSRGWIASANNKHVVSFSYPISHYYAMPDRFVRIGEMLTEKDSFDIADVQRMHADTHVLLAEEWVPVIFSAMEGRDLTDEEAAALDLLAGWDFDASLESGASVVFHATINSIVENTFRKRLGDELYYLYIDNSYIVFNTLRNMFSEGESPWFDDPDTAATEGLHDMIAASFSDAVEYLTGEMGSDVSRWTWGDLHTLTIYHPFGKQSKLLGSLFNIGPFPLWGSLSTVNPAPYKLTNPWGVYHGASMRYIIDFSDMKNSLRVIPAGISGNFMSPHYDDQVDLWRTVTYRPFLMDRESVEGDTRYVLTMEPQ
jgi:penicillin amidase